MKIKLPRGITLRNDSYVATFTVTKGQPPKRQVVGQVGVMSAKEAGRERDKILDAIERGTYVPPKERKAPAPAAITVTDLWNRYRKECLARESVPRMDRLELCWKHLQPVFGSRPADAVKPIEISDYRTARREKNISAATVNRELSCLSAMYRECARLGMVERVPAFPRKFREAKPRQGFIEQQQYDALAAKCDSLWLRTFLCLAYVYGCRKGELLNLRVADVDLLNDWLAIRDSKNGESRRLKLTQEAKTLLAACVHGKQAGGAVLTHKDGTRVSQPRKNWYALCVSCGLGKLDEKGRYSGLQIHDMRRSAVRRMLFRGMREDTAMRFSGHKTRSVFSRYNIVVERDVEQAAPLLESETVTNMSHPQSAQVTVSPKSLN